MNNMNDMQPSDFEQYLEEFSIRTENSNNCVEQTTIAALPNSIQYYVPLLIADIYGATMRECTALTPWGATQSKQHFLLFNNIVGFQTCIVHARIIDQLRSSVNFYKYIIDDGSACMELNIRKSESDVWETLHCLRQEIVLLQSSQPEMYERMRRILSHCNKELDYSELKIGSKVLVHGKPSYFLNRWMLRAFSLYRDSDATRDTEILFKDELIAWYSAYAPKAVETY